MIRALSAREARLVALLLLLAAIAGVHLAIVVPLLDGFAERAERRQELTARIAANERAIAAIPRLRRQAEGSRAAMARYVLTAADPASGADLLRDHLQNAVTAQGGAFRGGDDLTAAKDRVAARATATLTAPQLAALLADLQNAPPFLTIETLTVNADEASIVGHASALEVQLEASVPLRLARAR